MINRRAVLGAAAAWSTSAFMGTSAAKATVQRSGSHAPDGEYVDMHTHLGQTWNHTEILTAEVLLRWMDANRIAQSIVLPLVNPEASSYPLTSDFVLRETKLHRDRLIPFCCIDPRTAYRGGSKGLGDMLRRYQDAGAKGFGESKPGLPFDHRLNMVLFAACGEVGLPVLFHLDNQRNTDSPGLPRLENVLKAHPQTTFVGHGPGWWASISADVQQQDLGGYPKGPVAAGGAIDRLMDAYPNIHGELSAGSGANSIQRDLKFGREFLIRRQDRILFGTDFLAPGQNVPQFELFEQQLQLPAAVRSKIFRDNARKLLKL